MAGALRPGLFVAHGPDVGRFANGQKCPGDNDLQERSDKGSSHTGQLPDMLLLQDSLTPPVSLDSERGSAPSGSCSTVSAVPQPMRASVASRNTLRGLSPLPFPFSRASPASANGSVPPPVLSIGLDSRHSANLHSDYSA